jgi:hypothetical protein
MKQIKEKQNMKSEIKPEIINTNLEAKATNNAEYIHYR